MEHLDLVLWLILYPLSTTLMDYINTKERLLLKDKRYSENIEVIASVFHVVLYIFIAIKLY